MLSRKTLAILAAVVAALIVISVLQSVGHRRATSRDATAVLVAGEYKADDLGRIVLGRGAEPEAVVLEAGPDGWRVRSAWNARASRERIDGLLKALADLSGEYRSDKREVLADYGLAADAAVTIRAFGKDGREVLALEVGNRPEGAAGNFVKLPGKDEVYITPSGVLSQLGIYGAPETPLPRAFLDLMAVHEDRAQVDVIRLRDKDGTRELVKVLSAEVPAGADSATVASARATWEWKTGGGKSPNGKSPNGKSPNGKSPNGKSPNGKSPNGKAPNLAKAKVDPVLNALVSVHANDLDDPGAPAAAYGLDTPSREAVLVMADGRQLALEFGNDRPAVGDKPGGTWMRVRGQPEIWVVTEYMLKNVFKPVAELKPD